MEAPKTARPDLAGTPIREYIYLNGEPLAQVNAGSPETVTYLHTDHLGTPKFGTNAAGAQVWAWAPDSFGNGTPTGSATVNLRMPGQYFDAESGIFYNWNRYYNPEIGRYISSDPIGLEGGMNTFLYAAATPLMMADPYGLDGFRPWRIFPSPTSLFLDLMTPTPLGNGTCYQNGQYVCSTAPSPQATSAPVSQGSTCTSAANAPPPGNCTPEEHRDLQNRVENACGAAAACKGGDDVATLNRKIGAHSACMSARQNINNRCFSNGDTGHQTAIAQRQNSIRNCQSLMSQLGK